MSETNNNHHVTVEGEPLCQRHYLMQNSGVCGCEYESESAADNAAVQVRKHTNLQVRVIAGPCPFMVSVKAATAAKEKRLQKQRAAEELVEMKKTPLIRKTDGLLLAIEGFFAGMATEEQVRAQVASVRDEIQKVTGERPADLAQASAEMLDIISACEAKSEPEPVVEYPPVERDRDPVIKRIRKALKNRSGIPWSVTGGKGTSWGWIYIDVPPARRDGRAKEDIDELNELLGLTPAQSLPITVPANSDYRIEYVDRAEGRVPRVIGKPYDD